MRHGKKINHLGRKSAHRKAMLANMACSLIEHKRINTTVAKAKALRKYVEPLITKSKTDSTHSRRVVFSYLQNKYATAELFREVAPKVADRPGGYVRIIKTGTRLGDNAEMCMIELVDFNELYTSSTKKSTGKKRSRRGGKKKADASTTAATSAGDVTDAEVVEDVATDAPEATADAAPAAEEAAPEATTEEAPAADEAKEESADDSAEEEDKKEE